MKARALNLLIAKIDSELSLQASDIGQGYYYFSLPLAIVDSLFSLGVSYEQVINVVDHLARKMNWERFRKTGTPFLHEKSQNTMSELLNALRNERAKTGQLFELFGNLTYLAPKAAIPIRKADAVEEITQMFVANGIETFQSFERALPREIQLTEQIYQAFPSLRSGVWWSYLKNLCGGEDDCKFDRHIRTFTQEAGISGLDQAKATNLFQAAAKSIRTRGKEFEHVTPRFLDHKIWLQQRIRDKGEETAKKGRFISIENHLNKISVHRSPERIPNFDEFWKVCSAGGTTKKGLVYSVDDDGMLLISSPRAKTQNYRILKSTVRKYVPQANEIKFRRTHGWFSTVFDHVAAQISGSPKQST